MKTEIGLNGPLGDYRQKHCAIPWFTGLGTDDLDGTECGRLHVKQCTAESFLASP